MLYSELATGKMLLIDKPYGWTSYDVINKIKMVLKKISPPGLTKKDRIKIGHAGTLDPLAKGLLIVCTGKETRNADSYQAEEKEYTGSFILGATTPSGDLEKEIDQHFETSHITEEMIHATALQFIGTQFQTPPVFSAVKIDGRRAYKSARRGKAIEMRSKEIHITSFDITGVKLPEVFFRVVCSKGTYIRTLAIDYGRALNSGAHLSSLCRTRIGPYLLADAMEVSVMEKKLLDENKKTIEKMPE